MMWLVFTIINKYDFNLKLSENLNSPMENDFIEKNKGNNKVGDSK